MKEVYNHRNDANSTISKNKLLIKSNRDLPGIFACNIDGCLDVPKAQCLRCSKYYCFMHAQLCLEIHPNNIEIIGPLQQGVNEQSSN